MACRPPTTWTISLGPDSATVVIDMTTGERVAHFAEIDAQADDHAGLAGAVHSPGAAA